MTELFVKMDINTIQNGAIPKVGGPKYFAILASIACFMNDKGEAYPSQEKISELSGYSRQTVNKTIGELKEKKIDGDPILTIRQEKTHKGLRNFYVISPKAGFSFGGRVVKKKDDVVGSGLQRDVKTGLQELEPAKQDPSLEQEPKEIIVFDNAKQVLAYFQDRYFETYNVAYSPNWGRDSSLIKKKLLTSFTGSEIKTMIDVGFEEYETRWSNAKFPRITIGQICSWLGNEALSIASKRSKEINKTEDDSEKYNYDFDRLEDLLDM